MGDIIYRYQSEDHPVVVDHGSVDDQYEAYDDVLRCDADVR